jgi:hypothetical protein
MVLAPLGYGCVSIARIQLLNSYELSLLIILIDKVRVVSLSTLLGVWSRVARWKARLQGYKVRCE